MISRPGQAKSFIFKLASASLITTCCQSCSQQAITARHLAKGDQYFEAGGFDQAELEYKNVLQVDRLNPHAIAQLGIIYYDQGSSTKSFPYLFKGRELEPNNLSLRLRLGQALLAGGNFQAARAEANFVLDRMPQDPDAPLLFVATAAKPEDLDAFRQRLQSLKIPSAASAPLLVALGILNFQQGDLTDAEAYYRHALAIDPKSSPAEHALAAVLFARHDNSAADQALAAAVKYAPSRSPVILQYARFKMQLADVDAARNILDQVTRATPDYIPAQLLLAELAASQKKYVEGKGYVAKVLLRDPSNPEGLLLQAHLEMANGETSAAIATLERMQKIFPKSAQVLYELGRAYASDNDAAKARISLNQAVSLAPDYTEAIILLDEMNVKAGEFKSAADSLKRLLDRHPDLPAAQLLLATAYQGQGDFDDAIAAYTRLEHEYPHDPAPFAAAGEVLIRQNKRAEARSVFEQALKLDPNLSRAVEGLVTLDLLDQQYPAALQLVNAQVEQMPKSAALRLLQAKVYSAGNDSEHAEAALEQAIVLAPNDPTAYFLIARLYLATNRENKALADLQLVLAKNPRDTAALMMIGNIYELQKNNIAARDTFEKLLAIDPKSGAALNNLAYLYSESFGQLDKALEVAQAARKLLPNDPNVADTLGWLLYKKHQFPWALSLLQTSVAAQPNDSDAQFHAGMAYYMMGMETPARLALQRALQLDSKFVGNDLAKSRLAILAIDATTPVATARATFERAIADQNDDQIALARLAAVYEQDGKIDQAISTYKSALQSNPANVRTLMNLIRLYSATNALQLAFELAKSARTLDPQNPEIAHALGRLAYATKDYPWAYSLLQETARAQPEDSEVLFDLAHASYSMGHVPEAEAVMRHSKQGSLGGTQAEEASRFIELVEVAKDKPQTVAAKEKADAALKADPNYVPALVVVAEYCEQQNNLVAAQQSYEKILAQYPNFAEAQRNLAVLDAAEPKNDPQTIQLASKAREVFPDDAELAKAFGVALCRTKDFNRAASPLRESARILKDDPDIYYYLGMTEDALDQKIAGKRDLQRALKLNLRADLAAIARKTLSAAK